MTSPRPAPPSAANDWHRLHVECLLESYTRLTGLQLYQGQASGTARAREVYAAEFVLLSHGVEDDPLFNYANRTALELFELDWAQAVCTPSRQSAEPANQAERSRFMKTVQERGYIDNYQGVRISASGRRFTINQAVVWNVADASQRHIGQAATFSNWTWL